MATAKEATPKLRDSSNEDIERRTSVANAEKGKWERLWPVIACGAGLFSDGYLNNVRQLQRDNIPRNTTIAAERIQCDMLPNATFI